MFWLSVKTMTRSSTGSRSKIEARREESVSRAFFLGALGSAPAPPGPAGGLEEEEAAELILVAVFFLPRTRMGSSGILETGFVFSRRDG